MPNPKTIDDALAAYKRCREREATKYGEQMTDLGRLGSESAAPDPCGEAFNRLVQELLDYGTEDGLELGEFREEIHRYMQARRALKNAPQDEG